MRRRRGGGTTGFDYGPAIAVLEDDWLRLPVSRRADSFNRSGDTGFIPSCNRVHVKSFKAGSTRQTHASARARSRLCLAVELLRCFKISIHLGKHRLIIHRESIRWVYPIRLREILLCPNPIVTIQRCHSPHVQESCLSLRSL